jgi:hypothetical protein
MCWDSLAAAGGNSRPFNFCPPHGRDKMPELMDQSEFDREKAICEGVPRDAEKR